jgi:hypothetical protein
MIEVQYPEPRFRMKKEGDKTYLFDEIRKAWLVLTEEEWVRQNFLRYLMDVLHYPKSAIALEKEIRVGELKKRFDILVYDAGHQPWMLVECKEPAVKLSEEVLQQVLRYHSAMPCRYLVMTNGDVTMGWEKREGKLGELGEMPMFN